MSGRPLSFLAQPLSLLSGDGARGSKRTVRVKLIGQETVVPKSFSVHDRQSADVCVRELISVPEAELAGVEEARDRNWVHDAWLLEQLSSLSM